MNTEILFPRSIQQYEKHVQQSKNGLAADTSNLCSLVQTHVHIHLMGVQEMRSGPLAATLFLLTFSSGMVTGYLWHISSCNTKESNCRRFGLNCETQATLHVSPGDRLEGKLDTPTSTIRLSMVPDNPDLNVEADPNVRQRSRLDRSLDEARQIDRTYHQEMSGELKGGKE